MTEIELPLLPGEFGYQAPTLEQLEASMEPIMAQHDLYKKRLRAFGSIQRHFVIRWTHQGLLCGIAPSRVYGLNGYVKLPKTLFETTEDYNDLRVECHGGLTYGPDHGRYVGFDCAHAGDVWPYRIVAPYLTTASQRFSQRAMGETFKSPWPWGGDREWSVRRLTAEVNHLADQIKRVARGEQLDDEP